jgi:hydrogenase 3 maturation protease
MPLPRPLTPALLKRTLKKTLSDAGRIAVLGVGSDLRGDDVAGIMVVRQLKRSCSRRSSRCAVFEGGTAPENLSGEIIRFVRGRGTGTQGHVVFVDTADMKRKPGSICLLDRDHLAGVTFSTHQLPLSVLSDYLQQSVPVKVTFIAIQPKTISFGSAPSAAGDKAIELVVAALRGAIPGFRGGKRAAERKGESQTRR